MVGAGWWGLAGPFAGLAVNLAAQICGLRLHTELGLLRSLVLGFAAGLAGTLACDVALGAGDIGLSAANLLVYMNFGYCYFHFANLGETARRIRILREIDRSTTGLTKEEILARYNAARILDKRFSRLLGKGQILERDGRYFAKPSLMLGLTRLMAAAKRIVFGGASDPEGPGSPGENTQGVEHG